MKHLKFHYADTTKENLFAPIMACYLIGSMSILVILVMIQWLIQ